MTLLCGPKTATHFVFGRVHTRSPSPLAADSVHWCSVTACTPVLLLLASHPTLQTEASELSQTMLGKRVDRGVDTRCMCSCHCRAYEELGESVRTRHRPTPGWCGCVSGVKGTWLSADSVISLCWENHLYPHSIFQAQWKSALSPEYFPMLFFPSYWGIIGIALCRVKVCSSMLFFPSNMVSLCW